jgi:hypothetical protein
MSSNLWAVLLHNCILIIFYISRTSLVNRRIFCSIYNLVHSRDWQNTRSTRTRTRASKGRYPSRLSPTGFAGSPLKNVQKLIVWKVNSRWLLVVTLNVIYFSLEWIMTLFYISFKRLWWTPIRKKNYNETFFIWLLLCLCI